MAGRGIQAAAAFDELQRRYRVIEGDRRSYAEEVARIFRMQNAQVEKLKRENGLLKNGISLHSRAAVMGAPGILSFQMVQLKTQIDAIALQIKFEKRHSRELNSRCESQPLFMDSDHTRHNLDRQSCPERALCQSKSAPPITGYDRSVRGC